jgi:hypothetical protein
MNYIVNQSAIIIFLKGKTHKIEKTDLKYPKIINALSLDGEEKEEAIEMILNQTLNLQKTIEQVEGFTLEVNPETDEVERVIYNDEALPNALAQKIFSIVRDGLPISHFEKFWQNLDNNPSSKSVEELINFLEYKELPITDDGCFLAYKGVKNDYFSVHGNLNTKVLSGIVNTEGCINNEVGQIIEVRRRDVDDDRDKGCSHGLHCGSLDYARGFASKIVVVKVNPADVVSVPSDCSSQKCRVSKYEVIADFIDEIKSSVVSENGVPLASEDFKEYNDFILKVEEYINKCRDLNFPVVKVEQIQAYLSNEFDATEEKILNALQVLGIWWGRNTNSELVAHITFVPDESEEETYDDYDNYDDYDDDDDDQDDGVTYDSDTNKF